MNTAERVLSVIILTCAISVVVYLAVFSDVGFFLWELLGNIPFYTVNTLAMWLTLLNTVLLLVVLKTSREKPVQIVLAVTGIEQEQPIVIEHQKPPLSMEELPHA